MLVEHAGMVLFCSHWRARHARAMSASQKGLGRWWHPVISGKHQRSLLDWFVFFKEFGLFHKKCKMMEEESHTSFLPSQGFFISRLKRFTEELRVLAFLTSYPAEIYAMQQNAFSRQITQICSMSLSQNLTAHREGTNGNCLFFCDKLLFWMLFTTPR